MPLDSKLIEILKSGGTAVIPTDTLYGLVACAENPSAVEKVYEIKKRSPNKSVIILISEIDQLDLFNIKISDNQKNLLKKVWPGPVSVELPCADNDLSYLHHNTNTLAFRLPDSPKLRDLIAQTGPLIAPSANPEGETPAQTIIQAKTYFGDQVDHYQDGGEIISSTPSTLVALSGEKFIIKRAGLGQINPNLLMITYDEFKKVEMKVVTVKTAERVEGSDKLLKLTVDLGTEERQIVGGIGKNHEPETLVGRQIVIVANLEPRSLMGLESQGMLLAVSGKNGPLLLTPESEAPAGTIVS